MTSIMEAGWSICHASRSLYKPWLKRMSLADGGSPICSILSSVLRWSAAPFNVALA